MHTKGDQKRSGLFTHLNVMFECVSGNLSWKRMRPICSSVEIDFIFGKTSIEQFAMFWMGSIFCAPLFWDFEDHTALD